MADEPTERTADEIMQLMVSYQDFPHKREIWGDGPWGDGPWVDEPDELAFDAFGLPCQMRRSMGGNWCGYVCIQRDHPFYGLTLNQCGGLDVHGSVTYGEHDLHGGRGPTTDVWWLGFDCGHGMDLKPRTEAMWRVMGAAYPSGLLEQQDERVDEMQQMLRGTYRTVDYARDQTKYLAAQLAMRGSDGAAREQAQAWMRDYFPEGCDDE